MLIIGLTGSIATGKSTVSSLLSSAPYQLPIIDTDLLARKVVEPGTPGYKAIVDYFGPTTPDLLLPPPPNDLPTSTSSSKSPNRPLNRPALGRRIFGTDPSRTRDREVLNKIVHPAIRREIYKSILYYYVRGHWAVVLDVPLLFESGMDLMCGVVMVVGVRDARVQMERLRARDAHLSETEAEDRVRSQGDVSGKVERAEWRGEGRGVVVWNDGDKRDLEGEVRRAMEGITVGRWWTWVLWMVPPVAVVVAGWNLGRNFWLKKGWEGRERERGRKVKL
ncbi:CoaE-domain-containing protein [Aspergillus sclerotioniger CBS 115572]|uniref:CoaE-domain-containing protein n=1 Tax=Aspergillus sclerotioniger CBS 115572 TaxID=1450535 RepID=A0A317VBE5_9EURO|nr:CoaE-domain-containing protein [Aspergillus sclerotioniger CBS 115572]PWY70318.1 CoaE-domain-containing protein [Aspergillus sclerotioniger CBS 115572]